MRLVLVACTLALSGCFLPLPTAAPQSATTVGRGRLGATFVGELPAVDLLASNDDTVQQEALAPTAIYTFQLAYGLTDVLDLEASLDGQMYLFLFPVPLGASLGVRYQVIDEGALAVALAGRIGGVTGSIEEEETGESVGGDATYGQITVAGQANPRGAVRPGLSFSFIPASVKFEDDSGIDRFSARVLATTLSLTFAFRNLEIAPFANFAYVSSDRLDGETVATGGFSFAIRPQRRRPPPPPPPAVQGPPGGR